MEDEKRPCTAKKVLVEYEEQDNIFSPLHLYMREESPEQGFEQRERELNTYLNYSCVRN